MPTLGSKAVQYPTGQILVAIGLGVVAGVAMITASLVAGLLMALFAAAFSPRMRTIAGQRFSESERLGGSESGSSGECTADTIRLRLTQEKASLEYFDAERELRGDAGFEKTTEERIVWSELLELELQDIDEQMSRIRDVAVAQRAAARRMSPESAAYMHEGGSHERNDS